MLHYDNRTETDLGLTPAARRPHSVMPGWMILVLVLGPAAAVMVALWWALVGYLRLVVWVTSLLAARW